jgi:hypothetical protein
MQERVCYPCFPLRVQHWVVPQEILGSGYLPGCAHQGGSTSSTPKTPHTLALAGLLFILRGAATRHVWLTI